ncbi:pseudouridine synthase [Schizophyllum amplum]|uniref:Pseudouridine synthase n=1 Tax=Schizophyllum amplum TaxID=97359 RepID=A0A550CL37_9AGAR|nr:pseudouridine synthase [Auriculariopsis ampla]
MSSAVKRVAEDDIPLDAKRPKTDAEVDADPVPASDVQMGEGDAPHPPQAEEAAQASAAAEDAPVASSSGAQRSDKKPRGVPDPNSKRSQRKADKGRKGKDDWGRKGKDGAQQWVDRRRGTRPEDGTEEGEQRERTPRLPKRLCAVLIGFCGSGYNGMQIQKPPAKTIENELFDALVRAGAVSKDNSDDPVKVGLKRAARTDAGVHAAGNLVSLKLITTIPGVTDVVARVNEELPAQIRMWGYTRVTNSFEARQLCDSRKYTYFFPSYMLLPPKPGSGNYINLQKACEDSPVPALDHPFWKGHEDDDIATDLQRKRAWRAPADKLAALRTTAAKFEATHNFHNFTVGRPFQDRSCMRFMKKIEISEPAVYGDTEWISVMLHGQSFMLHQIRKMMSALVLSVRNDTPDSVMDELYGPRPIFIPKMPSLGLLLEQPIFESYNRKAAAASEGKQAEDPEYRAPIDFDMHAEEIRAFKEKFIYANMRAVEDRDGLFDAWVRHVDDYTGQELLYLNPKGTVPTVAALKPGTPRENPFREKRRFNMTTFDEPSKDESEDEEVETPLAKGAKGAKLAETEG